MELAQQFMTLFDGFAEAYGTYKIESIASNNKVKGIALTHRATVTVNHWNSHLTGKQGIGIIPIRADNSCLFGAIDIDVYTGLDYRAIVKGVKKHGFPLIPCRTKSGGVHLFLFVSEAVPALTVVTKLREMAAVLGYGTSEIFPKQTEVLTARGDVGQWINMPYFNGTKGLRYAFDDNGLALSPEQFVKVAHETRVTAQELYNLEFQAATPDLLDGPPCLTYLITQGFQEGMRNEGLFNLGVYARKAYPDEWEHKTEEFNQQFMIPPLKSVEIQTVIKSLKKKAYIYRCNVPPINSFCNKALCITRKFGLGPEMSLPTLSNLTKFDSAPPIWFLNVEGQGRMELLTEDLQTQERFQRRCMEALNMMPPVINKQTWQQIIQKLLEEVIIVEAPVDASPAGQLFEHLERFCTSRMQARAKDEILLGKPFLENGHHYFRLSDFVAHLDRHHFKEFKVNKISSLFKDQLKAEHVFLVLKGKGVNVWKVPDFKKQDSEHDVPDFPSDTPF
jgi:hypothetical protein